MDYTDNKSYGNNDMTPSYEPPLFEWTDDKSDKLRTILNDMSDKSVEYIIFSIISFGGIGMAHLALLMSESNSFVPFWVLFCSVFPIIGLFAFIYRINCALTSKSYIIKNSGLFIYIGDSCKKKIEFSKMKEVKLEKLIKIGSENKYKLSITYDSTGLSRLHQYENGKVNVNVSSDMVFIYGSDILVDANALISDLKWKSDEEKIEQTPKQHVITPYDESFDYILNKNGNEPREK